MDKSTSKGHLNFHREYEDFARPDGSVWRGKREYPIGEDGYRRHAYERFSAKGINDLFRIGFTMRPKALRRYNAIIGGNE